MDGTGVFLPIDWGKLDIEDDLNSGY